MTKRFKKCGLMTLSVASAAAVIAFSAAVVNGISHGQNMERVSFLSEAVRKAAVQCYAIEGYYPPDIGYLEENYSLLVDRKKYFVYYEAFASNIMPRIDVYALDEEGRALGEPQ